MKYVNKSENRLKIVLSTGKITESLIKDLLYFFKSYNIVYHHPWVTMIYGGESITDQLITSRIFIRFLLDSRENLNINRRRYSVFCSHMTHFAHWRTISRRAARINLRMTRMIFYSSPHLKYYPETREIYFPNAADSALSLCAFPSREKKARGLRNQQWDARCNGGVVPHPRRFYVRKGSNFHRRVLTRRADHRVPTILPRYSTWRTVREARGFFRLVSELGAMKIRFECL